MSMLRADSQMLAFCSPTSQHTFVILVSTSETWSSLIFIDLQSNLMFDCFISKSTIHQNMNRQGTLLLRRPLLARGTKAAGLDLIHFSTTSGHADQLSGNAFISLEGSNRDQIRPASSRSQDPFASLIQVSFSKLKKPEKRCSRLWKNEKIEFEIHSKRFPQKNDFCKILCPKTLIWKSQALIYRFRHR